MEVLAASGAVGEWVLGGLAPGASLKACGLGHCYFLCCCHDQKEPYSTASDPFLPWRQAKTLLQSNGEPLSRLFSIQRVSTVVKQEGSWSGHSCAEACLMLARTHLRLTALRRQSGNLSVSV